LKIQLSTFRMRRKMRHLSKNAKLQWMKPKI